VNRKSFSVKFAKLLYRFRNLINGSTISPRILYYETMTLSGFAELRRQAWPRLKMAREFKRGLAASRN